MFEPAAHSGRWRVWLTWALVSLVLLGAPWSTGSGLALTLIAQTCIFSIVLLSYNQLFGQTGMLSFGHAVYVGFGAYAAVHAINFIRIAELAVPLPAVPLAGALAGALAAVVLGFLSTRKAGTSFAMITLGIGELVAAAAYMLPSVFGGEGGVVTDRVYGSGVAGWSFATQREVVALITAWTLLALLALWGFTRTPLGRLANAVRDNPERVAFLGYDARRVRYAIIILAGAFAGLGGALGALQFEVASPENFSTARSGTYLLFTVIGGSGHFFGPVLGAAAYAASSVLLPGLTHAWLFYLGLLFVLLLVFAPGGLAGMAVIAWRGLSAPGGRNWLIPLGILTVGIGNAAVGIVWLIELTYRHRLGMQSAGTGVSVIDAASANQWFMAILLAVVGLWLVRVIWPHFRNVREKVLAASAAAKDSAAGEHS